MACEGCRRRREKMKQFAVQLTKTVSRVLGSEPAQEQAKPTSCAGCTTRATAQGWVNTCHICLGKSDPSPYPNANEPKCNLQECERTKK